MKDKFYTVEEAAQILKTKTSTVRTYCREGKIPAIKVGKGYRITESDLEKWLEEQKEGSLLFPQEEQKILEAEAKYKSLFENASDAIAIFDIKGSLVLANPKFYELSGYTQAEVEGMHFSRLVHSEDLPLVVERFMRRIAGEDVESSYQIRSWDKNKQIIPIEINSSRLMKEGKPIGIQVIIRDITERKRAEEALQESEEMYKTLVKASPDAVTVTDLEGNITYVSQRALQMHGVKSAKELVGRSAFELIVPEDREKAMINLKKTLKEGLVRNLEYTLLRKDGTRFIGELNAALIKDAYGRPKAFIATTRDVTERKRMEEDQKRLLQGMEASDEGISVLDENQKFIYVNRAHARIYGYKPEEIIGKSCGALIPKELIKKEQKYTRQVVREEGRWKGRMNVARKDGQVIPVSLTITAVKDSKGKLASYISVVRDISEYVKLEEEQRKLVKAIEVADVGIALTDENDKYVYINRAHARIHGYKPEELIGETWRKITPDTDLEDMQAKILLVLEKTGKWKGEALALKKDGKEIPISLSITLLQDKEGKYEGHICVVKDISEK